MTRWHLVWSPEFDPALLGLLAIIALLLCAYGLWQRARAVPLRILFFGTGLLLLAGPSLEEERFAREESVAIVLRDLSPSMAIGERSARADQAVAALTQALDQLEGVETVVINAGAPTNPDDDGTFLFTALEERLAGLPRGRVAGLFIISDGQVHEVPESLENLRLDAPLHLLLADHPGGQDQRLVVEGAPTFALVDQPFALTLRVEGAEQATPVQVFVNGVFDHEVIVPQGESQSTELTLDRRGPAVVEIEIPVAEGELTARNNTTAFEVNGVRERLRVLLVSGMPHAGERAWRNILKSDPSVDLVHFTILRPPEKQDGTPIRELALIAFPTRELFEERLDDFDLVIFDNYRRRGVLPAVYLQNLALYVQQGGALLDASGPDFAGPDSLYRTPLGTVLPVIPDGRVIEQTFRPEVTALGLRHPVTSTLSPQDTQAPWGRWVRQVSGAVHAGTTVMTGAQDAPLLVLDRVGEGRVAELMSDQSWLWSRGFDGGGPQAELLRRVAHWLMQEPDLEEEGLFIHQDAGHMQLEWRSLTPGDVTATLDSPDGTRSQVLLADNAALGRATAEVTITTPGLYRVTQGENLALVATGPVNPREFADPRANPGPLMELIEASDGGLVDLTRDDFPTLRQVDPDARAHGSGWLGLSAAGVMRSIGIEHTPALPAPFALLFLLGFGVWAWLRESR